MAAEPNPWRETVGNVFNMLVLSQVPLTALERRVLAEIKKRHHDYFCAGKTIAEWKASSDVK